MSKFKTSQEEDCIYYTTEGTRIVILREDGVTEALVKLSIITMTLMWTSSAGMITSAAHLVPTMTARKKQMAVISICRCSHNQKAF